MNVLTFQELKVITLELHSQQTTSEYSSVTVTNHKQKIYLNQLFLI